VIVQLLLLPVAVDVSGAAAVFAGSVVAEPTLVGQFENSDGLKLVAIRATIEAKGGEAEAPRHGQRSRLRHNNAKRR